MSDIYFSNYRLQDDIHYFLYIGELKNYGLNAFLKEALSRIENRPFDFISIVPDVFEQYNYKNLIVVNPEVKNYSDRYGRCVSCRVPANRFLVCVSENPHVRSLVQELLHRQKNVYIYMYESLPEMTLDQIPGVSVLGPDSKIARRLNSKIYQYKNLEQLIPVVDYCVCEGFDDLRRNTERLWQTWTDGIFVSLEYSAAGTNSMIAQNFDDIDQRFHGQNDTYFISRYIPHREDPTVLAVVASEDDVYIAGIADQCIERGTCFTGSTFPTRLEGETTDTLKNYTRSVGRWLAKEGYRGIYGCDFLVDDNGRVFFLEVNARKQGTTLEFCCTLEQNLPPGSPLLPELEYYAVTRGHFPENTVEMKQNAKNINWGTYNYKIDKMICTEGYIPQSAHEREAFGKVAENHLKKDFLILEHVGNDFIVAQGSFIGRIVALGHDPFCVRQGLDLGRKTIDLTIQENIQEVA